MWRVRRGWTQDHWGSLLADAVRRLYRNFDILEKGSPEERYSAYFDLRDNIESVEYCSCGLEVEGTVHRDLLADPLWITQRTLFHIDRLEKLEAEGTRKALSQRQGVRKVIRKYNEHAVLNEYVRQAEFQEIIGQPVDLTASWQRWIKRRDRKAFDGPIWMDDEAAKLRRA